MHTFSEDTTGETKEGSGKPAEVARRLWPLLVELWIFSAIVTFFLIRVLGSKAAQRLLSGTGHRHFL
jgi:hypothetical protein